MIPNRKNLLMALALDHFFRAGIITSGVIIVAPSAVHHMVSHSPSPEDGPNNNRELNEKIKSLGISNLNCLLGNLKTSGECTLNKEQMEKINFFEKDEGKEFKVGGLDNNKTVTLRIEKGYDTSDFPETLRFTFSHKNTEDVVIGEDLDDNTTLKANIDYDYKFQQSNDPQLMKIWTLQKLGVKVGFNIDDSNKNTCEVGETTVNVWKSGNEYVTEAKAKSKCLMEVTKDSAGYLEGFKLVLKDEEEVNLTEGTGPTGGTKIDKLTKKNNTSYEIGMRDVGGTRKWFLIVRTD